MLIQWHCRPLHSVSPETILTFSRQALHHSSATISISLHWLSSIVGLDCDVANMFWTRFLLLSTVIISANADGIYNAQKCTSRHSKYVDRETVRCPARRYKALITAPYDDVIGNCSARAHGNGFSPIPDTVEMFRSNPAFRVYSGAAVAPPNYTIVFSEDHRIFSTGKVVKYVKIPGYDPHICAELCNQVPACQSFNLFFERTPTLWLGPNCTNSPSSATIRCVL